MCRIIILKQNSRLSNSITLYENGKSHLRHRKINAQYFDTKNAKSNRMHTHTHTTRPSAANNQISSRKANSNNKYGIFFRYYFHERYHGWRVKRAPLLPSVLISRQTFITSRPPLSKWVPGPL